MLDVASLIPFVVAATILIVVPGPAVFYIVARAIEQGRPAGLSSVLGVATGELLHAVAAAIGLSAILATSALAFSVVKYLGALYLIYLGIATLHKKPAQKEIRVGPARPLAQIYRQGVVVSVLNPKAALFFLAFLPQFADPARGSVPAQILLLGLIFVAIALVSDGAYALLAGQIGGWLKRSRRFQQGQRYFSGTVYLLLGVTAAFSGNGRK